MGFNLTLAEKQALKKVSAVRWMKFWEDFAMFSAAVACIAAGFMLAAFLIWEGAVGLHLARCTVG